MINLTLKNLFTHLLKKGAYMKKILSTLFVIAVTCSIASAKEEFSTVCANHILVPNEMDAIKLKSQIKDFSDFQYYARMYSTCPSGRNGGDLGCFGRRQMVKPFEEAAFNGKIGEVSEPVKTEYGYHLLWVTKKY